MVLSTGELLDGLPVPSIPALDGWRSRVRALQGMMPLLTPEEASAWAGVTPDELSRALPHIRVGEIVRFKPKHVMALVAGTFSLTVFRANQEFPGLFSTKGNVYFIEAVGSDRVKIGFTEGDVEIRRRRLQTSAPFELRTLVHLPASLAVERYLHRAHQGERILPTAEWFHHRGSVAGLVSHLLAIGKWP